MTDSPNLALPHIAASQAQKEVTHNEALNVLDTLVQASVINSTTTAPPGSPTEGQAWIVGAGATGAWAGHSGDIASWYGGWTFHDPKVGWLVWDQAGAKFCRWSGSAWVDAFSASTGPNVQAFTSSGIWTKPAGKTIAIVELWGAGGGGGSGRYTGAAGGSYQREVFLLSDLGSTVAVAIGAGGAGGAARATDVNGELGVNGGNTTFGTHLTGFGGGGGERGISGTFLSSGTDGAGALGAALPAPLTAGHNIMAGGSGLSSSTNNAAISTFGGGAGAFYATGQAQGVGGGSYKGGGGGGANRDNADVNRAGTAGGSSPTGAGGTGGGTVTGVVGGAGAGRGGGGGGGPGAAGGNGARAAGGGGGGFGTTGVGASGAGGNGGAGYCVVTSI